MSDGAPVSEHVLDHLWNGWRAAYVAGNVADRGTAGAVTARSVFSQILDCGLDDAETNIVHRGKTCFVIMNAFPYTSGHVMVLPYREVADLEQLTAEESAELWATVTDAVVALRRAYRPNGLNVGLNLGQAAGGSVNEHLHVHVVPRWIGDSNFMTAVANTRTLPEAIADSAAKIRSAWGLGGAQGSAGLGGAQKSRSTA
jgi:ATP adenylyltransferase